VAFM